MSGLKKLAGRLTVALGLPLVRAVTRKGDGSPPERVLVVRADGIGDLILTIPFLRGLRHAFPTAEISLVAARAARPLLGGCPYVDEVFQLDARGPIFLRPLQAARLGVTVLRGRRFDLAVVPRWDFDGTYASLAAGLSGAPRRVGFSERVTPVKQTVNRGYDSFFTEVVDDRAQRHELERGRVLLEQVAPGSSFDPALELWLDSTDARTADELLAPHGELDGPLVAFCPGGTAGRRRWPLDRYRQVAGGLAREGARVVLVGGPEEAEECAALAESLGTRALSLAGRVGLRETAAALSRCALYVGNDTGPMHIAAAAGVRVVAVSCHPETAADDAFESPARFGPRGVPAKVLRPPAPRPPCRDACVQDEPHCILDVSVEDVAAAAARLL
jgi:heptosyltransferase-2